MAYVPKRVAARSSVPPPGAVGSKGIGLPMRVRTTEFVGVNALARELGIHSTMVTRLLRKGQSPDELREKYIKMAENGVRKKPGVKSPDHQSKEDVKEPKEHRDPFVPLDKSAAAENVPTETVRVHGSGGQVMVRDDKTGQMRLENEWEAKARKERALATEREIRVAQALQTLVPRVQVEYVMGGVLIKLRDVLSRMEIEMRDVLAAETDPIKVGRLIGQATGKLLSDVQGAMRKLGGEVGQVDFSEEQESAA